MFFAAKEKGEKKLFGFSFVPLMQEDGRTLPDGTHELIVHKVTSVRWWRWAVKNSAEIAPQYLIILKREKKMTEKNTLVRLLSGRISF